MLCVCGGKSWAIQETHNHLSPYIEAGSTLHNNGTVIYNFRIISPDIFFVLVL